MASFYGYTPQPFVFDFIISPEDFETNKQDYLNKMFLGRYLLVQESVNSINLSASIYCKVFENGNEQFKLITYLPFGNGLPNTIVGGNAPYEEEEN